MKINGKKTNFPFVFMVYLTLKKRNFTKTDLSLLKAA